MEDLSGLHADLEAIYPASKSETNAPPSQLVTSDAPAQAKQDLGNEQHANEQGGFFKTLGNILSFGCVVAVGVGAVVVASSVVAAPRNQLLDKLASRIKDLEDHMESLKKNRQQMQASIYRLMRSEAPYHANPSLRPSNYVNGWEQHLINDYNRDVDRVSTQIRTAISKVGRLRRLEAQIKNLSVEQIASEHEKLVDQAIEDSYS